MTIDEILNKLVRLGSDNTDPDEVWDALYHLTLLIRKQDERLKALEQSSVDQEGSAP